MSGGLLYPKTPPSRFEKKDQFASSCTRALLGSRAPNTTNLPRVGQPGSTEHEHDDEAGGRFGYCFLNNGATTDSVRDCKEFQLPTHLFGNASIGSWWKHQGSRPASEAWNSGTIRCTWSGRQPQFQPGLGRIGLKWVLSRGEHLGLPGAQARDERAGTESYGCSLVEEKTKKEGFIYFPVYKRRGEGSWKGRNIGGHRAPLPWDGGKDYGGLLRRSFDDAPQPAPVRKDRYKSSSSIHHTRIGLVCYSGNLYWGSSVGRLL